MHSRNLSIRIVYAICLIGATINHVRGLFVYGWLREGVPMATSIYWSSLTFLDPLAALLLFLRPRAGIVLTLAIIASDVAHNLRLSTVYRGETFIAAATSNVFVVSQIVFLLFVLATAPMTWRVAEEPEPSG